MKTPKYYMGRELDYYLLWVMGLLIAGTGIAVFLGACASQTSLKHKCFYKCIPSNFSRAPFCYWSKDGNMYLDEQECIND